MVLSEFKYQLEKGSKKHRCPSCERKRFVRYEDVSTGEYLPEDVGRCDRELSCGYHKTPRETDGLALTNMIYTRTKPRKKPKASTLPNHYLKHSLGNYESNVLISWMASLDGWDMQRAEAVARKYNVGTSSDGWAIFWQVDEKEKIRAGKMMKYDSQGHRIKKGYSQDWIHSKLKKYGRLNEFNLEQCFYGLHLKDDKPVALVESEKTALIASQYLPAFTWMATGQLNGINEHKLKALQGMQVVLFPDIGALESWKKKADELSHIADIKVSELLERNATNENKGYDLADYLIQFDLKTFKSGESGESGTLKQHIYFNADAPNGFNPYSGEIFDKRGYPASWGKIQAPEPGTIEYMEAEYYRAMDADPILKVIDTLFEPKLIIET